MNKNQNPIWDILWTRIQWKKDLVMPANILQVGQKVELPSSDPLGKRKAIVLEVVTYEGIYPYYELKLLRACKSKHPFSSPTRIYSKIGRSHRDLNLP